MRSAVRFRALFATSLAVALAACSGGQSGEADEPAAEAPAETAAAPESGTTTAEEGATPVAALTGDPAKGEKLFIQCKACHVLEPGQNRVGPSLHKVVGRAAGTVAGFSYSDANKNSGVTWTTDVLFQYLEDPKGFMPGTKMAFPGIKNAQDRANLVAYLESTKK